MTIRLTKVQAKYREDLKSNLKLYIGYNCPSIMKSFNILVEKGFAKVVKEYPGLGKDFVTTEFHIIRSANMMMGKGIRPGNHTGEKFTWIVTPEALERINAKKGKYELVY